MKDWLLKVCCLLFAGWPLLVVAQVIATKANGSPGKQAAANSAYLFVYFTGNDKADESIHYALSNDGYTYRALNSNQQIISSEKISSTGGVRDPHILRGADGKTFYMVVTDMVSALGWSSNRAMVLLKSTDLINWTSSVVNIQKKYAGQDSLLRVWAPQTIYDAKAKKYMLYWSMKHGKDPDKIYYAYASKDFTDLEGEPKQLFFSPTNGSCIDGDIIEKDGRFHLFFKTEGEGAGIKMAVSDKLTGGYVLQDKYLQQTKDPVEGSSIFKLNNSQDYILMYDVYTKGRYQFTKSKDLKEFTVIDQAVSMNFHPRHGTVLPITHAEAARLMRKWGNATDVLSSINGVGMRPLNTLIDTATKTVTLSIQPGTNLSLFKPSFYLLPGTTLQPVGQTDFSKGPVSYNLQIAGQPTQHWRILAKVSNNPVLAGYYADPDVLFAEKTGKYYIYPTSDGFNNWSGTYFKAFSSADLVNWEDEGVILDLEKDVSWAKRNAWAPCIMEKKVDGAYKYYYYFTAAQKIGVAVADDPAGPFVDMGKALIDKKPEGIKGGQEIDPEVFNDPQTGKNYLYWGNGYMAVVELSEDMISFKPESLKIITPSDKTFREGTTVFFRKGLYYFLWSEEDTRSENYRVRYGTATSPVGPISIPVNNLVLAKETASGIYGTGHNSILQIPGRDEWYFVYHRFNYPNGIKMGRPAGFHREVCMDKLSFDEAGNILPTIPTHKGVPAVAANTAAVPGGSYQLVWADEFNKDGQPDTSNWSYEIGFERNEELQWYQPENARCENGMLIIEARKETKPNPRYEEGSKDWRKNRKDIQYTSSCLISRGKHAWQYGRFEMRARIDISNGMWPAWWTLGISKRWPANGEIDIMEYYRGMLLANIACLGPNNKAEWYDRKFSTDSLGGKSWANQFHVWRMDWTEKEIALYIDDILLNKTSLDKLENKDGSGFNPFKQPHYMLLNLAMGGMNGGDVSGTTFPQKFEVDYVRVYQQK